MFNVTTAYPGATHDEIRDVFALLVQATSARWAQRSRFDFRWLRDRMRRQLEMTPATLLSFVAHYAGRYRGVHVVAVVSIGSDAIEVIDPLARSDTTFIRICGKRIIAPGPYTICNEESVAILVWQR